MAYRNTGVGRFVSELTAARFRKTKTYDLLIYNFDSDSSQLKSPHTTALDTVATLLNAAHVLAFEKFAMAFLEITIVGGADRTGDAAHNQILAKQRADAVYSYLSKKYKGKVLGEFQGRGRGTSQFSVYVRVMTNWIVQKPGISFNTITWENLAEKLLARRPPRTPAGGMDHNRAVFVRTTIRITENPPAKRDLDHLINKAFVKCGIYAIAAAIAEIGKMHTSQTSTFVIRAHKTQLEREIKYCILLEVLADIRSLPGPMSRLSKQQLNQEIAARYQTWSKKLDLVD